MGRPIRANARRTRSRGTIRERVGQQLQQLDTARKAACEHLTHRRRRDGAPGWECIDCGVIR